MRDRFDNFDREFDKTSRLIRGGMVVMFVVNLVILALIIAAAYAIGHYFGVW